MTTTVLISDRYVKEQFRADVVTGLTATQRWLPSKWLYDKHGSELFDLITRLPEYYPTRIESELLVAHASELASIAQPHTVVELGPGSGAKAELFLLPLISAGLRSYVPIDFSDGWLSDAIRSMLGKSHVAVSTIVADYETQLGQLPAFADPTLIAFLGASLGNLMPKKRIALLREMAHLLNEGGCVLVGVDLRKSPDVLIPAYDDSAGVTARFNKNVLSVINNELQADFNLANFDHAATWEDDPSWIEMRLYANKSHTVRIDRAELEVSFRAGEYIRTEISAKFTRQQMADELAQAGLGLHSWWTDDRGYYALCLAIKDGRGSLHRPPDSQ
ncbi:L-histidine N(alpha)-methyltransferase [Nocardia sp. NPDC050697]|uniref:L-histidine N(alpha)-methyltransferase n=1 Tax=Nocardia sp. NPDC050697 TaxID=3155158 RepID=UPI0033E537DC